MAFLQIEDLLLEIEQHETQLSVLQGVNITLDVGETVALVGETGSGKTMTAMSTLRLLPPKARISGGRVWIDGLDIVTADADTVHRIRGRKVGIIFQQARGALNPTRPVVQQVADRFTDLLNIPRREALERSRTLLGTVGLPTSQVHGNHYPHQLSGGMCQRVMIALAIAAGPNLLLADEPTTGLDVTLQAQIMELLARLVEQNEMGLLLITHDLAVVGQNTQRVYVMYAGEVVETGPTPIVLQHPRHPYSQGLVHAVSSLEAGKRPVAIPGLVPRFERPPNFCPFVSRCAFAFDRCHQERPTMHSLTAEHGAACHLVADGVEAEIAHA